MELKDKWGLHVENEKEIKEMGKKKKKGSITYQAAPMQIPNHTTTIMGVNNGTEIVSRNHALQQAEGLLTLFIYELQSVCQNCLFQSCNSPLKLFITDQVTTSILTIKLPFVSFHGTERLIV